MKKMSESRRPFLGKVLAMVIVVALIGAVVGCGSEAGYKLTVSSTAGGVVTAPGEDTFEYSAGTVVELKAVADEGYRFTSWTGDVGTVADPESAETTITMDGDYSITADFAIEALEIRTWHDMDSIRDNLSGSYALMNNLDSTTAGYAELAGMTANDGRGWEPIGAYDEDDADRAFVGHFDGRGNEIRDLFIDRTEENGVGLFGFIGEGGVIEDIGVVDSDVRGNEHVGGVVGVNWGALINCYSNGSVSGKVRVGGIAGRNENGTVSHCYSSATVAGEQAVAGLVGQNLDDGTVSDCYSSATVVGGWQYIGGLVGSNYYGVVNNSHYNYDDVLISGQNIITTGALFKEDFEEWLANDKFLDVDDRLSQENGQYLISSVGDLKQLLAFGQDSSLKFKLQDDLDLGDHPGFFIPYLAGQFDGDGHRIWNLSFDVDFVSQVGLFGNVAVGSKVTRLGVENVDVTGARSVGGLAGTNHGTVSDCYSTGVLRNTRQVGGLVGGNGGTITDSYSTASVSGFHLVGGLVGGNVATVTHSYSMGEVSGDQNSVGGLVGGNTGMISYCYSTGSVSGLNWVGGLVGSNQDGSAVTDCYSTGSVSGNQYVGGLLGSNGGSASNSYSIGSVTGSLEVGGLVGRNGVDGTVSDSFWDVETSGMDESAGGTGKSTEEMMSIVTFTDTETEGLDEPWDIMAVASGDTNTAYVWNIVDGLAYPFLSWQSDY